MTKESYALFTGLFLLLLGAATVGITLWLGHYGDESDTYIVTTSGSVSGLVEESTVLYRGVNAGKVSAIAFDPEDVSHILVRILVKKDLPITHGTYAKLRIQGLTGLAQIELGDDGEDPAPLPTSDDEPARIAMRPSLVDKLSDTGGNFLLRAEELIARLNAVLDDQGRGHIRRTLINLEHASAKLVGLEERMDQAFARVPALSKPAQQALKHFDDLTLQLRQVLLGGQALFETAGDVLDQGKTAGQTLNQATLPRLNDLLEELHMTATELKTLSSRLGKDPQMLLYGPQATVPAPGEPGYSGVH